MKKQKINMKNINLLIINIIKKLKDQLKNLKNIIKIKKIKIYIINCQLVNNLQSNPLKV